MSTYDIVGVTVGIGTPHSELSLLASACFSERTGIPSIILGPDELSDSGLLHPAALRLKLFDYVDAKTVVYFDADWVCLQPWNPRGTGNPFELLACRDFILTSEWPHQHYDFNSKDFYEGPVDFPSDATSGALRLDYIREVMDFADLRLPWCRWINSGLMVISQKHHRPWLDRALELYQGGVGHHSVYYEQPALVKAMEQLNLPLRLLPRQLNVLAAYERRWPESVIGLHIKPKRHPALLSRIREGSITNPRQLLNHFYHHSTWEPRANTSQS